jgi:hypothetical protein
MKVGQAARRGDFDFPNVTGFKTNNLRLPLRIQKRFRGDLFVAGIERGHGNAVVERNGRLI